MSFRFLFMTYKKLQKQVDLKESGTEIKRDIENNLFIIIYCERVQTILYRKRSDWGRGTSTNLKRLID